MVKRLIAQEGKIRSLMRSGRMRSFQHPEQALAFINRKITNRLGKPRKILIRAHVNAYTGYGILVNECVRFMQDDGYDVDVFPHVLDENYSKLPKHVSDSLVDKSDCRWELRFHPPNCLIKPDRPFVLFTMWESTGMGTDWVTQINRSLGVIVPSVWNANNFSAAGVKVPIFVVPLGVDSENFSYEPMDMDGPCVFGVGGRMAHGGIRKGINASITDFQAAFPNEEDVRLKIKGYPDCPIRKVDDTRVRITQAHLSTSDLHRWYSSLTAYYSASKSGGWELMPHEALATGRPILGTNYGGIAEYFTERVGYPVSYSLIPAGGMYSGYGLWSEADKKDLIRQMRRVYSNRNEAQRKGLFGSKVARKFTWENTVQKLSETLSSLGLI